MVSAIKTSTKSVFTYYDGAPFGVFLFPLQYFVFLFIFELREVAVFLCFWVNFPSLWVFYGKILTMPHFVPSAIRISYVCIRFFGCLVNEEKWSQTLLSIDISCEAASINRDNRKMGLSRKVSLAAESLCAWPDFMHGIRSSLINPKMGTSS